MSSRDCATATDVSQSQVKSYYVGRICDRIGRSVEPFVSSKENYRSHASACVLKYSIVHLFKVMERREKPPFLLRAFHYLDQVVLDNPSSA